MSNELYHANNFKYIKREWKSGRWNYTYPDKNVGSNKRGPSVDYNGKHNWAGSSNYTIRTNTDKLLSSKTTINYSGGKTKTYHNVGKIERAINDRKKDWAEAKKRSTDNAIKEATKYDGGIVISEHGSKNIGKTSFIDSDKWLSGTTTIETPDTRITQVRRGKLERGIDTAKEYLKDRLGFDEKETYEKAVSNMSDISNQKSAASTDMKNATKRKNDSNNNLYDRLKAVKDYDDALADYNDKTEKYAKAKQRVEKTGKAYSNTPVGKVAEAKERIDSAKDYIDGLFGKKRKK